MTNSIDALFKIKFSDKIEIFHVERNPGLFKMDYFAEFRWLQSLELGVKLKVYGPNSQATKIIQVTNAWKILHLKNYDPIDSFTNRIGCTIKYSNCSISKSLTGKNQ